MTEFFSPDEIRDHATKHGSNKAFERYCQSDVKPSLNVYDRLTQNAKKKTQDKSTKIVKLDDIRKEEK